MDKEELFHIQSNTLNVSSGKVLISEPFTNDFYFKRSIIFLIDHHDKEGSFGVIFNKKLAIPFNEIVKDFPYFEGDVYLGGPIAMNQIFFIHTVGELIPDSHKICKGIYWSGNINTVKSLIKIGLIKKHEIRFYIGYAGWDVGQLKEELQRNSWLVGKIPLKLLLNTNPNKMWNIFVDKMGKKYQLWNKFPINPINN